VIIERKEPPADADEWLKKAGQAETAGALSGRSSARETAVRVAAGAIARKWLRERYGITLRGWMSRLGEIDIPFSDESAIDGNPFFAPDTAIVPKLETYMDSLRKAGDSVGAEVTVVARGVPVGWGDPVYDRLDADIAYAMMGINAVKGVEIGAGFRSVIQRGSEHGDELTPQGFLSNNAGGVLGGISTGQEVVVRMAVKPTSSIRLPRKTINVAGEATEIATSAATIPASAFAPLRSPRPCWRLC
jgi:chorismate synthase